MHKTVLVTAPSVEPITRTEAKAHLNVTSSTKDGYIDSLITTVRRGVERYLKRALITQTWKVYYNNWDNCLKIPFPKLQSVTHVKYRDLEGVEQTLPTTQYWVTNTEDPGSIVRAYGVTFPELQYGRPDSIEIQFVAGYGLAADVPDDIKHAMKLWLTDLFDHRGEVVIGPAGVNRIPGHIKNLIHDYRIYSF